MSHYTLPNFFPPVDSSCHFGPAIPAARKPRTVSALSVLAGMEEEQKDSKEDDRFESPLGSSDQRQPEDDDDDDEEKVCIFVKEPKIDSVLLIKSLTEKPATEKKSSPTNSPRKNRPLRRRNSPEKDTAAVRRSAEDALQFELSISSNGRNYTAVRSLPTIQRLRQDLLNEVEEAGVDIKSIPELPCWKEGDDGKGGGVVGRSFSFLHGCLRSYAPALEGWLRAVTAVVPTDSPTLAHFLWEPLWLKLEQELIERESSISKLDAIVESDTDEESDEEEP